MEEQSTTTSTIKLDEAEEPKQTFSYWACFLFGPYYLAYKGFLKHGIYFCLLSFAIITLVIDYGIQPRSESLANLLYTGISLVIYFLIASRWEKYVAHTLLKPNTLNRFLNLFIILLILVFAVFTLEIIETKVYEVRLASAKSLDKNGKQHEAFDIYQSLCIKEVGEACFQGGLSLANSELHDKAAVFWKKGCELENAEACYLLGLYIKNKNESMSKKIIQKACRLGVVEACQN